ncbi:alpha-mannosidase [Bacilli bacterium]|nr:alpha-mannosidase [Bacilli bacterium]
MKKVYVISHSHLDREWYMPYEQHHMRVVELFDELLDSFENDSTFRYFHLDGQTIPIDDYLEVKPEKRSLVEHYIKEGRLRIGPFYILQDDFLISSEANIRNMLVGFAESKKYGNPVKLGYFPDTFGNMGQTPQLMQKVGLDAAAFGRGVTPTGFNNQVSDAAYASQYSEMNWIGPDGSEILGVLFANWYSNGNEIPTEKRAAKNFWDQKLADTEKFASTDHLLMMNGCDHQPLQKDVGAAIALANELYPDYEFIHSNFDDYLTALKTDLPMDLGSVQGELTSQATPGWYTLANTASARVYLKQANVKNQVSLENLAEPLATFAAETGYKYPQEQLTYAWKLLMQNHPHDSICGCSVDDVHREMMTRYQKSTEVANFVQEEAIRHLTEQIDTSACEGLPFVVFNTAGIAKREPVTVKLEIERILFKDSYPKAARQKLLTKTTQPFKILDSKGQEVIYDLVDESVDFNYDLPKDAFRVPYMAKYLTLRLSAVLEPMSYQTYSLIFDTPRPISGSLVTENGLENDYLKATVNADGSLTLLDKVTNQTVTGLIYEDTADIGNEYIYKQDNARETYLSTDFPTEVTIVTDTPFEGVLELITTMNLPVSAAKLLKEEQENVVDITNRQAGRSQVKQEFVIKTRIALSKEAKQVKVTTSFDNQHQDHRLRVLFPTAIQAETHFAESICEVVERPNHVSDVWQNPTNPQHQQAFVNLHDETHGLTIGNIGLNEYEISPDGQIAVTLLRCVGEMGDWGYFPTPDAQCLGQHTVQFSVQLTGDSQVESYLTARGNQVPLVYGQTQIHQGKYPMAATFLTWTGESFALTASKQAEDGDGVIIRGYNLLDEPRDHIVTLPDKTPVVTNLLEEEAQETVGRLGQAEIQTLRFR